MVSLSIQGTSLEKIQYYELETFVQPAIWDLILLMFRNLKGTEIQCSIVLDGGYGQGLNS